MRRERKSIKSRADNVLGGSDDRRPPSGVAHSTPSPSTLPSLLQQQQSRQKPTQASLPTTTSTLGAREAAASASASVSVAASATSSSHFLTTLASL